MAEPTNVVERFLETARTFPGRPAVHASDGALTFEELADRTARLASVRSVPCKACTAGEASGVVRSCCCTR
ncbi:hypothetical protein ABZY83_18660, partial [Streptomyces virginiae]|uniref:hypothetical protein n=1 Tax=Streptomyces virginiae TaxID=1961 RepID=UPI0033BA7B20